MLKPNPVNPNRHSAHQIQLLASIIQEQGWRNPVTVSKRSGLIVRGHGRLEAALLIGCETIPVDEQDYASDAEELADLLADNRLSELAELDEDDLRKVLRSIQDADPDFDIELTGFMEDEIRKLMDDADNPEDELETIPKMECQAFETHDYLVFMFHDLRDWMQVLQLMLDDDISACVCMVSLRCRKLSIAETIAMLENSAWCARGAGARLFGWHQRSDPRLLQRNDPFGVNHWVGGAVGVVRDENGGVPKWDELLKCKCDIDATLQELMDNRLVWNEARFCFV